MLDDIKAVIFDLDGTLIDSMWIWENIDLEYLKRFQIEVPHDLQDDIEGMSFSETAVYFKNRFGIQDSIEDIVKDWNIMAWEIYRHQVPLKKGVIEILEFLKKMGLKMGIATSNSRELVNIIMDKYDLNKYFLTINTSCEVGKGKPYPDIYLKTAEDLGTKPEKCLVFEDVLNGIRGAQCANMKVCAVFDKYSEEKIQEIKKMADYYVKDFHEVFLHLPKPKNAYSTIDL